MAASHDHDGQVITDGAEGAVVSIHASPRASASSVGPLAGCSLRVRVTASAVEGAANLALIKLLSEVTKIPRSHIEIVAGQSSRRKRVLFRGVSAEELAGRLGLDRSLVAPE